MNGQLTVTQPLDQEGIEWNAIRGQYDQLLKDQAEEDSSDPDRQIYGFDDILTGNIQGGSMSIDKTEAYTRRLGVRASSVASNGHAFLNGRHFDFDEVS